MTTLLALSEPNIDFIRLLFEVISAFATVGVSTGITASLTTASKVILVGAMYIGRVSVLLLIAAIIGDSKPTSINYPEENLLVG